LHKRSVQGQFRNPSLLTGFLGVEAVVDIDISVLDNLPQYHFDDEDKPVEVEDK